MTQFHSMSDSFQNCQEISSTTEHRPVLQAVADVLTRCAAPTPPRAEAMFTATIKAQLTTGLH